ncbi:MAG: DUF1549 domain-containing protein [Planctomycetota bacterium]|nr:DUF1549 domain-containing protein [Planctomycetota bacterium]
MKNSICLIAVLPRLFAIASVKCMVVCLLVAIASGHGRLTAQEASLQGIGSQGIGSQGITSQIDRRIALGYSKASIVPAEICTDEQFVRRLYLDIAGRIPTLAERASFIEDRSATKRLDWIDRLLVGEDYVQNFADTFDTLLMGRASRGKMGERQNHWRPYLEDVFRSNRPWDQVAREILLARPEGARQAGAVWFLYERNDNAQAIAEAVAPAFFGIRIDCAQCHDHMIATEIHQQHYWGLVAFFNRSKNAKTNAGPRLSESAIGGFSEFANIYGSSYPNLLTFYESKTIDETRPEKDAKQEDSQELYLPATNPEDPRIPKFSRREKFVEEILNGHPRFAKAFVNRIWAMLMGRGIVHPYDQMDSVHAPSDSELLDGLAEEFIDSGYDIRGLVRGILAARPYQLGSLRPAGAEDPSRFAWSIERPLTAEQLGRSLQIALFQSASKDHACIADLRDRMPEVLPETFVTDVGDALFLTNNPKIQQMILEASKQDGLVAKLALREDTRAAVDEMFHAILGRSAEQTELDTVLEFVQARLAKRPAIEPISVWQSAVWAVLTSAEFRFNH